MLIEKLVNFAFNHKNKLLLLITILSIAIDGPPNERYT